MQCRGNLSRFIFRKYSSLSSEYAEPVPGQNDRIFVAMSAGVDSSTAAGLLAKQYPGKVTGIHMSNWSSSARCFETDWNDVQRVCETLDIPCKRVNFEKEYWMEVFEPMIEMYKKGLTPNPDVSCNRYIKFGSLLNYLDDYMKGSSESWWLATGHYASIAFHKTTQNLHLLQPRHLSKDQRYYLSTIEPKALKKILFPLSNYEKPTVRQMAKEFGIHTAFKPDSQGLCFVSQDHNSFKKFLADYVSPVPGDVVTESGTVVGKHDGIWEATIGQRSNISMPQGNPETRGVWYVSDKDIRNNRIIIVRGRDNPSLYSAGVQCSNFHWLGNDIDLSDVNSLAIQYRSLQDPEPVQCVVAARSDSLMGLPTVLNVKFQNPRRAVAPGQYLALYQGPRILGSGVIRSTFKL